MTPRYRGIFPVAPTTFTESGALDLPSQKRCLDFMIDSGVDGICILANFSEQFLLSDDEREVLTRTALEHVAGRVPVLVDGGVRSGTDVFRALALGAGAVGVGRPVLWSLAAHGQAGVAAAVRGLTAELRYTMATCGAGRIADITGDLISRR